MQTVVILRGRHSTIPFEFNSEYIDLVWNTIENHITEANGQSFKIQQRSNISGGCINQAFLIADDAQRYFIKLNSADRLAMFEAESAGLLAIIATASISSPQPLCSGTVDGQAYLVMNFIDTEEKVNHRSHTLFGEQLAAMHRKHFDYFGWQQDNTIGSTLQTNACSQHWINFWREQRLGFQLELAAQNGFGGSLQIEGGKLMACFDRLFNDYTPQPSLLHGDLWSGNYCFDGAGNPVIFDPACYYGDRECDIAMTELFGGFNDGFYRAYQNSYPLDSGYQHRKTLYNLYHILNHLNLFGGGYLSQVQQMIQQLLRELK